MVLFVFIIFTRTALPFRMDTKNKNEDNCLLLNPEDVHSNPPSPSAPLEALISLDSEVEPMQPF